MDSSFEICDAGCRIRRNVRGEVRGQEPEVGRVVPGHNGSATRHGSAGDEKRFQRWRRPRTSSRRGDVAGTAAIPSAIWAYGLKTGDRHADETGQVNWIAG